MWGLRANFEPESYGQFGENVCCPLADERMYDM